MTTATEILQTPPASTPPPPGSPPPGGEVPGLNAPANGWWDTVSDPELKGFLANKNFEKPEMAFSAYKSLESLLGADRAGRTLVMPKDDTDVEGMKAFRQKMGIPDTPEGYKLPLGEKAPEGYVKTIQQLMHQAAVPPKQAEQLVKGFDEYMNREVEAQRTAQATAAKQELVQLEAEWGPEYKANEELARRGLRTVGEKAGLDDAKLQALEAAIGTASMLKMFQQLGAANGEAAFRGNDTPGTFGTTLQQAQDELASITTKRQNDQISEMEWRETYEARALKLLNIIAAHGETPGQRGPDGQPPRARAA